MANSSIIAGYASGWKNIDAASLDKFTHINLAYAEPQPNGTLSFSPSYNSTNLAEKLHEMGSQALLSVGGYAGSIYISDILKSPETRSNLIKSISEHIRYNRLDGVDIDWSNSGCNHVDQESDTRNLLLFLRELRQFFSQEAKTQLIALGVGMDVFSGPNGQPLTDVSEYSQQIDYINILAYDVNSPMSFTTGPNAPLSYESRRGPQYSLASTIDKWVNARFPAEKIAIGLAFYGRAATTKVDMSAQPWNVYQPKDTEVPRGDNDDGLWADRCTGKPASFSGIWSYKNLRAQGLLDTPVTAAKPWIRYWDSVSLTPWLYNPDSKMFISYDDKDSIQAKVDFVKSKRLRGVTVYDVTMDSNSELMDVVRNALSPDPAPSFSSSAPGSNPSNNETPSLQAGSSCGWKVKYRCVGDDGTNRNFMACASGVWLQQQCGSGTACVQNGDYIYCDYPH